MPLLMTVADTTAREALVITQADVDYGWEYKQLDTGVYYRPIASGTGSTIWAQSRPSSIRGYVEAITSVDNEIARYSGVSGQLQGYTSGGPTISDTGTLTMAAGLKILGTGVGNVYTPAFTTGTNTTGAGTLTGRGHWVQIGSQVVCSASILDVAHTAGAPTASTFEITIPVASNFAATTDLVGTVTGTSVAAGYASGSIANDRMVATYSATASGNLTVQCDFIYTVI